MDETRNFEGSSEEAQQPNARDAQGFKENPAAQGLKTPPPLKEGEDSGEWTGEGALIRVGVKSRSRQAFHGLAG